MSSLGVTAEYPATSSRYCLPCALKSMEPMQKERSRSASEVARCKCARATHVSQMRDCSQSKLINALKGYSVLSKCFFLLAFSNENQIHITGPCPAARKQFHQQHTKANRCFSTEPDANHYEKFLAEQKQREYMWRVNKAAKRQRIDSVPTEDNSIGTSTPPNTPPVPVDKTHELRAKLHSKTEECEWLKRKVEEMKETNGVFEKAQHTLQENLCKVTIQLCY